MPDLLSSLPVPKNIEALTRDERANLLTRAMHVIARYSANHPSAPPETDVALWAMYLGNYEITVRALEAEIARLEATVYAR